MRTARRRVACERPVGSRPVLRNARGLTYLGLMLFIVTMGIFAATAAQQWSTVLKRDKEEELAFRGNRIKRAIEKFASDYEVKKSERDHALPRSLEELTKPTPYLAKVYNDPLTGKTFELIKADEYVVGVKSRSKDAPLSRTLFKEAKAYNQVEFKSDSAAMLACKQGLNMQTKLGSTSLLSSFTAPQQAQTPQAQPGGCQAGSAMPSGIPTAVGNPVMFGTAATGQQADANSAKPKPPRPRALDRGAGDGRNGTVAEEGAEELDAAALPPLPPEQPPPAGPFPSY